MSFDSGAAEAEALKPLLAVLSLTASCSVALPRDESLHIAGTTDDTGSGFESSPPIAAATVAAAHVVVFNACRSSWRLVADPLTCEMGHRWDEALLAMVAEEEPLALRSADDAQVYPTVPYESPVIILPAAKVAEGGATERVSPKEAVEETVACAPHEDVAAPADDAAAEVEKLSGAGFRPWVENLAPGAFRGSPPPSAGHLNGGIRSTRSSALAAAEAANAAIPGSGPADDRVPAAFASRLIAHATMPAATSSSSSSSSSAKLSSSFEVVVGSDDGRSPVEIVGFPGSPEPATFYQDGAASKGAPKGDKKRKVRGGECDKSTPRNAPSASAENMPDTAEKAQKCMRDMRSNSVPVKRATEPPVTAEGQTKALRSKRGRARGAHCDQRLG